MNKIFKVTDFWDQAQFIKMTEARGRVKLGTGFCHNDLSAP